MSKYNLQLLGWKQFEDLATHVMQMVFGLTFTPFALGRDGGRDGYYVGTGELNDKSLSGRFTFQCKHTSKPGKSFSYAVVADEYPKVTRLVSKLGVQHYVIFTNYSLTAEVQLEVETKFLTIDGLKSCTILGDEWFTSTIDSHRSLRRLVPRLYGIGDLSEILDDRVRDQSAAILEELRDSVTTFVSTQSHRSAFKALNEYGFVILLGPPAVGKTAIATNLCMTAVIEEESTETIILNHPHEFRQHWNPNAPHKVFWFDDAFGTTSLDNSLIHGWNSTVQLLTTAIKRGAMVIFTSRDYIFREAQQRIKQSAFPLLFESQVCVDVKNLSGSERQQILYNHIKHGNIERVTKTKLKPYLQRISKHVGFTPELARRLGNRAFHQNLNMDARSIDAFLGKPVRFFEDVINSLDDVKKAALVLILVHGNSLPSPVTEEHLTDAIVQAFNVSLPEIKQALEVMRDSLVKISVVSGAKLWSLFHPSMVDSLQTILAAHEEMLEVFIEGASLPVLIRDVTCVDNNHKIFVPKEVWPNLIRRLTEYMRTNIAITEAITRFLLKEVPDEFLAELESQFLQALIDNMDDSSVTDVSTFEFCYRMKTSGLFTEELNDRVVLKIKEISLARCDLSFLDNSILSSLLNEKDVEDLLNEFAQDGDSYLQDEFEALFDECDGDPEDYLSGWFESLDRLKGVLESNSLLTTEFRTKLDRLVDRAVMRIADEQVSYSRRFDDDAEYEYYRDSMLAGRGSVERDIFSDVDE